MGKMGKMYQKNQNAATRCVFCDHIMQHGKFRGSRRNGIWAKGDVTACRGRHGEVGIVDWALLCFGFLWQYRPNSCAVFICRDHGKAINYAIQSSGWLRRTEINRPSQISGNAWQCHRMYAGHTERIKLIHLIGPN